MKRHSITAVRSLPIAVAAVLVGWPGLAQAQSATDPQPSADAVEDTAANAEHSVIADSAAETTAEATQASADASGQADPTQTDPSSQVDGAADAATSADAQINPPAQTDTQAQAGIQGQADLSGQASVNSQAADGDAAVTGQTGVQTRTGVGVQASADGLQANNLGLQFGQATARGLPLNAIDRNSLFINSGLRARDVLVSLSGQPLRSYGDFQRFIALHPGQRIPLVVLRDGRQQTIYITPPANVALAQQPTAASNAARALLGVTLNPQIPNAAVVQMVTPNSPAEQAGLRPGDMINALNDMQTRSPQDVSRAVSQMRPGQQVAIDYSRRVRAQAVLAGQPAQQPYTVAYPPQAVAPPAAPVPDAGVAVEADPGVTVAPRYNNDRVTTPADTDGDGRIWDGDGRRVRRSVRR